MAKTKILIVEDHHVPRQVLSHFLADYGQCDVVVDGVEALDAYRDAYLNSRPYDLIMLDIMLPILDGLAVLEAIRLHEERERVKNESLRPTCIVILTGLEDKETFKKALRHGCAAFLAKPIDLTRLKQTVELLGFQKPLEQQTR